MCGSVLKKNPSTGEAEVIQENNYYAFGGTFDSYVPSAENHYFYNGKEEQKEWGVYDYGARFYDPVIGRWHVVDPMAENHYNLNPYHYVMNNPMLFIDPLGLDTLKSNWVKNGEDVQGGDVIDLGYGEYSHVLDPVTVSPEKTALEYVDDALKTINEFNPIVNLTSGISGLVSGRDMYGRDISASSSILSIASVIPIAKLVKLPGIAAKTVPSLTEQAATLSQRLGKNSITLGTPTKQIRFDLVGKAHGKVPTLHMQIYNKNFVNGVQKSISRASKEAVPMTQQEIRMIRKYIETLGK
ncbi:MAG TPA: RHS repeat-associated core domain-containing protein [Flavisolibacter sp.]|nr:RHS repeat-associated core domain-containing protein [Flavisolibacter sp.]